MKICTKCNDSKGLSFFNKRAKSADGFQNRCKKCQIELQQNYRASRRKPRKPRKTNAQSQLDWQKNHPDLHNARNAKRRATKLSATPKWLTKEQLKEIQSYYTLAKELQWLSEEPLEVDHIVPLQGKNVSGLHVPWNLQILPKAKNCSKGNR